ncbi:hypothetical protein BG015_006177 [Linnemannia schmuckeri]|uniref:G-protein coupled receptors family 2 profile 2 domain-containing protein n=1 Tax=Linnemannia schmuckeri TaxID=64567 RepID=A0A9P5S089_9FUNG|nr:hypothetical protein BG015_006177 [Linnemannia schmuckeri]
MINKRLSSPLRKRHYSLLFLASTLLLTAFSSLSIVTSAATPTVNPPTTTSNYVLPSLTPASSSNDNGPSTTAAGASFNVTSASLAACPPPMIPNIYSLTTLGCNGPCCLPCPVSSVFYEPHKLENIYTVTSIIRICSAVSSLFLSICYLILPSRRKHPHLIVLVFAILIVPWDGLGTAWLFMKEELLCVNEYEVAHMMNSWYCGLSGTLLPYLSLVILSLGSLLITNLHLLTVYRSSFIQDSLSRWMVVTFVLPLGLIIPIVIKNHVMNPGFGSICFVGPDMASAYFFLPLSIVICVATLLHLGTIAFMIKVAIVANSSSSTGNSHSQSSNGSNNNTMMTPRQRRLQTARDITHLLKQQWRPGLLAFWLILIDAVYSLFYFIEAKKLLTVTPNSTWFQQWVACLANQVTESAKAGRLSLTNPTMDQFLAGGEYAQRACAPIAAPFVPSFVWAAVTDLLPSLFGIAILIIFGSKVELWQDLRERLFGKRYPDNGKIMMGDMPQDGRDKVYNKSSSPGPLSKGELTHFDSPYGSQANLASVARVSFQKSSNTNNGSPISKDQSPAALEPWNPSAWVTISTDDNSLQPLPRASSPPPKSNNNHTLGSINAQRKFYNSEDLDAVSTSILKSPTLSNASAAGNNRGSEVSSKPADKTRSIDEYSSDPRLHSRSLSPPPSRPNKNMSR